MTMIAPLTDQQLDEISTRADVATDGPWERYEKYGPDFFACTTGSYLRGVGTFNFGDGTDAEADEEFVKHAVQDIRALVAEVHRLRAELGREERLHSSTIADRDRATDAADVLAYAVASEDVIGEHTADNSPWANALELITSAADVDKLRAAIPPAVRPSDDHEAVYVDEQGLLYGEYRSSPKTADTHLLRLQWADEMAESKTDLEAEGAVFQLLGWSK